MEINEQSIMQYDNAIDEQPIMPYDAQIWYD